MLKSTKIIRIDESMEYWGFGFCVKLLNVPMVYVPRIRFWTPNINFNILDNYVRNLIINKEGRLTPEELRYLHLVAMEKSLNEDRCNFRHSRKA